MRCLLLVVVVVFAKWPTSKASKTCKYFYECTGSYKNCCDRECDYRRFCNNYCSQRSHCGPKQYCVTNVCTHYKPSNYCDDSDYFCPANHRCMNNLCVEYCNCANEKCVDGICNKRESDSDLSPASIAGFTAMLVIGACIACSIRCIKRTGGQLFSQQREIPLQVPTQQANVDVDIEAAGGSTTSEPVLPGGPPSYDSLERTDGIEEPPPPSYEEAVRNSHNNLNV